MRLSVTTPRGSLIDTEVEELIAPGALGEFGVLPGHIPLLSALRPGVLIYKTKDGARVLAVGQGMLEVVRGAKGEQVLVLVDQAVPAKSVDKEEAQREVAALEKELVDWKRDTGGEFQATLTRRAWAQARIDAADRAG